jgi:hypothetical protein
MICLEFLFSCHIYSCCAHLHAEYHAIIFTGGVIDKICNALSAVCSKLLEEGLRFGFCERAHCVVCGELVVS